MSKIKIQGDGGGMGTFTILSPDTDTNNTITLPAFTGTLITSSQSIVPNENEVFDLGSSDFKWKDLYLSGSTINLGDQTIKSSPTGIQMPQLTIGTGINTVTLAATSTGKLEQSGTNASGQSIPVVNIPQKVEDLSDVDLTTLAPTNNQGLFWNEIAPIGHHLSMTLTETFSPTTNQMTLLPQIDANRTEGTYTVVTGTSSGSGTVGTYNITVDNTGSTTTLEVVTFGTGHVVDDIITITDADLGAGGAADVTMTVLSIFNERVAGTYTGVTGTSGGTGTVGTFDVTVAGGIVSNIVVSTNGSGNSVGDVITIADANLGGGTGTDFTMSVASIDYPSHFGPKDAILEFSDFADVDTVTTPPTNSEVLSWDDANNNWSPSPNGAPYIVSNVTELLALTNLASGQKALVTDTNRIYQYTGSAPNSNWRHAVSGWYALASITMSNGKPAAVTGTNATYTLDDLGESIIVTTTVADPEQFPTEWSFEFDTDPAPNTTVTQKHLTTLDGVSNVFTITPGIHPWDSATFNVTFKAKDDSLDTTDAISEFTLTINVPDWETNANWHSAISNLDFNAVDSASMNGAGASFYGQSVDVDERGDTIIISDPYYAAPKAGTTGVNAVGAIHIYNKNTTAGVSTWTKNSQTLVDPIDAAGATGGDGNPVSVTNIGGFSGNRGTVDDMSTGDQIALSSDGKTIVSMYGNGANTRAPTFNFDSTSSTYLAGDSLYLTDVLDQSGNQDGIYLGPNNTLGQTVLGTQPKLAISKDGNTCILGYGMEGPKGMKFTYGDPRTDHPLISPHGSLNFPEFGHDRHTTVNNFVDSVSAGLIVTVNNFGPIPQGHVMGIGSSDPIVSGYLNNQHPDRTPGTYTGVTITTSGTGTIPPIDITVDANNLWGFPNWLDGDADRGHFGTGHRVGDIFTIADADIGGGGAPDVTIDINVDDRTFAGTYTGVTGTSSGTGTVGTFDIIVDADGITTSVTNFNYGAGHTVGDIITVPKATFSSNSNGWMLGVSDFTMTVATIDVVSNRIAGTYTGVTGTSSGTGTVGTFDITIETGGNVSSVTVTNAGYGHTVGDVITIADADLGGGIAQPFTVTVATIESTDIVSSGGTVSDFIDTNVITDTNGARASLDLGQVNYGAAYIFEKTGTNTESESTSEFAVSAISGAYVIDGTNNPTLNLIRGSRYQFNLNVSGHPFYIKTSNTTGAGDQYTSGVTGNGNTSGTLIFEVPNDAPSTLYYKCGIHSAMGNSIVISGTGTNTATSLWNSTNSEWGLKKKISGVNIVDTLGASVDLSADGTVAIASAPRGTADINSLTTSANGGYVTVFDSTTTNGSWTQVTTLRPPANIIDNSVVATGGHPYLNSFSVADVLRTIGTYTGVTGTSSGSGNIGFFDINVDALGRVSIQNIVDIGNGNSVGDIITIADADLGGGGAADFTMTITNLTGINAQSKRSKFGGSSISISGDGYTIAVGDLGSANENPLATSATLSAHPFVSGCVHIYKKIAGTWTYNETLLSPLGTSQDGFGSGVDLNLNGIVLTVGSINESSLKKNADGPPNTAISNSGSMYTFISQDTGNYFLSTGDNTTIGNCKQVKKENILPFENSNIGSLMGRPKITTDGKTIVSGHKSLETNNNSGRVEIWTEGETNTLGEITGLDPNYTLNNDGTSTNITVSASDLTGNEIWWSFATSNATGGLVTEKRHATPFDISKSQTDEISEFSSGNWTLIDNNTMNNFSPFNALGKHMTVSNFSSADANRTAGTYTGVAGTSSGTGTVGTFDILVDSTGNVTSVTVVTQGSGHTVNDTITIANTDLGAGAGAADFTMDIATIDARTAGTYTGVTGTSSGSGTVGTFDITIDSSGTATDVTVVTLGSGHTVGDTITIPDADLGNGGTTDFTMDIATISDIAVIRRLFGNTNRPRSFKMESLDNVGTANSITTDFDYVALNTTAGFTNPTGTGPENTFIITPNSDITLGGSFDLTITVTDGINVKTATTTLTLPV